MSVPRSCDNRIKKFREVIDAPQRVTQRGLTVKIAVNMWDGHMPQHLVTLLIFLFCLMWQGENPIGNITDGKALSR